MGSGWCMPPMTMEMILEEFMTKEDSGLSSSEACDENWEQEEKLVQS